MDFSDTLTKSQTLIDRASSAFSNPSIDNDSLYYELDVLYKGQTVGLDLPQKLAIIINYSSGLAVFIRDTMRQGASEEASKSLTRLGFMVRAIPLADNFVCHAMAHESAVAVGLDTPTAWSEYIAKEARNWFRKTPEKTIISNQVSGFLVQEGVSNIEAIYSVSSKNLSTVVLNTLVQLYTDSYDFRQELSLVQNAPCFTPAASAMCKGIAEACGCENFMVPIEKIQYGKWDLALEFVERLERNDKQVFIETQSSVLAKAAARAYTDAVKTLKSEGGLKVDQSVGLGDIATIARQIAFASSSKRVNYKKSKSECLAFDEPIAVPKRVGGKGNGVFPLCSEESAARILSWLIASESALTKCLTAPVENPMMLALTFGTFVQERVDSLIKKANITNSSVIRAHGAALANIEALSLKLALDPSGELSYNGSVIEEYPTVPRRISI